MLAAKTTPKRKPAKRDAPPEGVLDAVAAMSARGAKSFLRLVARHPALSTGIAFCAVIFTSVSVNALYEQHGRHPNPMLVTRTQPVSSRQAAVAPPSPSPASSSEVSEESPQAPAGASPSQAVDAAWSDREDEPTLAELSRIPAPAPRPLERPDPEQTASIETASRVVPAPAKATGTSASAGEKRFAAMSETDRVKKIQSALAAAQVADLSVDGVLGEKTKAAIRTFEALEGMNVTGNPNAKVLARLSQIGLVQ